MDLVIGPSRQSYDSYILYHNLSWPIAAARTTKWVDRANRPHKSDAESHVDLIFDFGTSRAAVTTCPVTCKNTPNTLAALTPFLNGLKTTMDILPNAMKK